MPRPLREPARPSSRPRAPLQVTVVARTPGGGAALQAWLRPQFLRLSRRAGVGGGEISLVLVGDREMAALHRQYQGVRGTTDVLTFDLREPPGAAAAPLEGDLVLCLDTARREARARGHALRLELLLYALHGLLHLLGYDDRTAAAAARMHAREDELLTAAGFGRIFAGDRRKKTSPRRHEGGTKTRRREQRAESGGRVKNPGPAI